MKREIPGAIEEAERDTAIEEKDTAIEERDTAIDESNNQIQLLTAQILEKDNTIERNDTTIAEQQRQIASYRNNPHWVIRRDEITITQDILGKGGWGEVRVGVLGGSFVEWLSLSRRVPL